VGGGRIGLVDDDLGEAVAIAQVQEDQLAVIASAMDPAGQVHLRAGITGAQLATGVGPVGRGKAGVVGHGRGIVAGLSLQPPITLAAGGPRTFPGSDSSGQRARRYVPADQIATQDVRATLAGRAVRAAPACQSTIVRKKGEIAGILRGIAGAVMARVVAMDPVFARTRGRGRWCPDHAGQERFDLHESRPIACFVRLES